MSTKINGGRYKFKPKIRLMTEMNSVGFYVLKLMMLQSMMVG